MKSLMIYKKAQRESGIELLRIVLMFMIIIHHLICQGLNLQMVGTADFHPDSQTKYLLFTDDILIVAVNCFFFISGYYGIKFRSKNILSLLLQSAFYAVGIDLIFYFLFKQRTSPVNMFIDLFSIITGKWWFLSCYFFLYLLSPFLNAGLQKLSVAQYRYILIVLFVLNTRLGDVAQTNYGPILGVSNGYSVFSFSFIYLLGRYIYLYVPDEKNILLKKSYAIFLGSLVVNFLLVMVVYKYRPLSLFKIGLGYGNPFIVIAAVSLFFCFKQFNFKNTFINSISTCVFGVYLIHVHPLFVINFDAKLAHLYSFNSFIPLLLFFMMLSLIILTATIAIEKIRSIVFTPVVEFVFHKSRLNKLDRIFSEDNI